MYAPGMCTEGGVCVCVLEECLGEGVGFRQGMKAWRLTLQTPSDHMVSLWLMGRDQSMNSGSGRVSGFSNLSAKWDVSKEPGLEWQGGKGGCGLGKVGKIP